jgi:phosphate transport system protein
MARAHYQRELQKLQDDLIVLGSMVRQGIAEAVASLRSRDLEAAKRIIAYDREINRRKYEIEGNCLTVVATQQPTAGDMRLLAAVLEISTELERMGDYAKGISRISLYIGAQPLLRPVPELTRMCDKAMDMMGRALDAFVGQDLEAARAIPLEDDDVDAMYNRFVRELVEIVMADPAQMQAANYLSWAAHNLERAADRVTNICERIIYTATGDFVEFDQGEPEISGVN